MSKAKTFARVIKITVYFLANTLRVLILRLLGEIFHGISKRLRFSITFKTVCLYTLIFSIALFLLSVAVLSSFGFFLLYETKNSLEKNTRVTVNLLNESAGIPEASIKAYADIEGITVTLFDRQKEVVYSTGPNRNVAFADDPAPFMGMSVSGTGQVVLNTQNAINGNLYYIQLSRFLFNEWLYLAVLLGALTVCFILAIVLTVVIGARVLRKMLKPIGDMISTAKSISASDLHTRLNVVDSHDELKDLAETFNEMLSRIETSYKQQKQFVSDASHELRTPIAVIQGYANLLQRWGKEDREVLGESVSAIYSEADNMKNLVERLLFLARADKNTMKPEKSPFSMNELIDEVIKETKMIDTDHNIICSLNEAVTVNADRGLIKQALRVFLDNSIKFTPPQGIVRIDSCKVGENVKLIIEDNGIGISKEDLPLIFNRFYKCDKSRTREGQGSGLGLSIAKLIIENQKGFITVESAPGKGTKIIVTMPV